MSVVGNAKVYGLEYSFKCSKYPMATDVDNVNDEFTPRILSLGTSHKGEGHDNFLNGIIVQFDLKLSVKAWVEAERYHFLDFISSQSTMHCISKMEIRKCCNEYVTEDAISNAERCKEQYLQTKSSEDYLRLLYNIPVGFELTAGMTTNYRQLKTIYSQRKLHRLPEWREFCKWIETLPHSELIVGVKPTDNPMEDDLK